MPSAQDVQLALSRIRGVLAPKQKTAAATRDIRLGLDRILRVVPETQTWQGVHVAGTNGKGSICAYLSGMFTLAGLSYGRYVSPAFPERHNAVQVNGVTVNPRVYETEMSHVQNVYSRVTKSWRHINNEDPGQLSPFELETATAFRIFNKMNLMYGIVEVGMGGATDATNVMKRKAVTVISKIDLDHQEYLGNTIEEIAKVKAGIMRPGIPCVIDHTNSPAVTKVLEAHARKTGTNVVSSWTGHRLLRSLDQARWQLEDYQRQNLLCAVVAFRHLFPHKHINLNRLMETEPYLPGRLEWVSIHEMTDNRYNLPLLVDAAHNQLGCEALAKYVGKHLRGDNSPITWIMGMSSSTSKPFDTMMAALVQPQDNVAFIEYSRQDGDPQPTPASIGRQLATTIVADENQVYSGEPNLSDAVQWATTREGDSQVIVTGSLYLVRDFYLMGGVHRSREMKTRRPGTAQLRRHNKTWGTRPLTMDEYKDFERAKKQWKLVQMMKGRPVVEDVEQLAVAEDTNQTEQGSAQAPEVSEGESRIASEEASSSGASEPSFGNDPVDQDATNGKIIKRETQSSGFVVLDLQRTAIFHRRQADGYRSALRSLSEDVQASKSASTTATHGEQDSGVTNTEDETLSKLQAQVDLLQQQADKHSTAFNTTMDRIYSHPDAPRVLGVSDEVIHGRARAKPSAFRRVKTSLDAETARQRRAEIVARKRQDDVPSTESNEEEPASIHEQHQGPVASEDPADEIEVEELSEAPVSDGDQQLGTDEVRDPITTPARSNQSHNDHKSD